MRGDSLGTVHSSTTSRPHQAEQQKVHARDEDAHLSEGVPNSVEDHEDRPVRVQQKHQIGKGPKQMGQIGCTLGGAAERIERERWDQQDRRRPDRGPCSVEIERFGELGPYQRSDGEQTP
jgi:hypothetical protein